MLNFFRKFLFGVSPFNLIKAFKDFQFEDLFQIFCFFEQLSK